MTEAPGGSAGFGHGSDPEEHEALLRRIREFLRHGAAAEAGVEEWGEFAAQLRFLREELPPEERSALLERWDRVLLRALPDLQLPTDQRENVLLALEAAAAEGAAWAALEDRAPPEQASGVAPVLRPSVWTLDWESAGGGDDESDHREDEALVLTAADVRTEARFVLADRLVLAHLAADVRGLLAEGQSVPTFPEAEQPTGLPSLRVDAEAGFACTGFSIRGLPAIGIQSSRNDPPLAFLVLDADQLGELLERARELLGTSA
jgi:hypothetical protein